MAIAGQAELVRKGVLTPEQYDQALALLVRRGGNVRGTVAELQEQGFDITRDTLREWKKSERYIEMATQYAQESKDRAISQAFRDQLHESHSLMSDLRERLADNLEEIEPKEIPGALQKLSVGAGIATEKMLLLEGRPTEIRETRNPDWYEQKLKELAEDLTVDGTAEEL